jgi:hypothetical protein
MNPYVEAAHVSAAPLNGAAGAATGMAGVSRTDQYAKESLRLEAVTTCVGFDDFLDVTLELNNPHFDTVIVVTTHNDVKTQKVADKHGAICVLTDLFTKNERNFNKGAAINAGMGHYQYHGWRMHLDADIIVPDNFRRILFNHTTLDRNSMYGADRGDLTPIQLAQIRSKPQHVNGIFLTSPPQLSPRYVDTLRGYVPIGFFQLWHASAQKPYPYSLGTAAHDDVLFAEQWPRTHRLLLPSVICTHLVTAPPVLGENWDGVRSQPRL